MKKHKCSISFLENRNIRLLICSMWMANSWLVMEMASSLRDTAFVGYSEGPIESDQQHLVTRGEIMVLSTHYGDIRVVLRADSAPKTVHYIKKLAKEGLFDGCSFYRAEPSGETIDMDREGTRRGYALVQGGLFSCKRQQNVLLPIEPTLGNNVGTVALITGTSEFFFNLEDHHEWDKSFTVWGTILDEESSGVLKKIVVLPTFQEVHPSGTVMRILTKPVMFTVHFE